MPIYEFLCGDCNTVFNFLSVRVNTTTIPACPRCQADLSRQVSIFRTLGRDQALGEESEGLPDIDEARLTKIMGELVQDVERCPEDDPRQIAGIMRKFSAHAGVPLGDEMEETLAKLESGVDPEGIEEELGDAFESDNPATMFRKKKSLGRRPSRPFRDETLYLL